MLTGGQIPSLGSNNNFFLMFISPTLFQVPEGLSSTLGPCEKQGQNPSFQSHDNFPWMVATHSSILAWEELAEESGGLPSKGSQRGGHD